MATERMHVAVRLRPRLPSEAHEIEAVVAVDNKIQLLATPKARRLTSYKFDRVFGAHDTNRKLYETFLQPVVKKVLAGTHATVLAYGQTGTGKTYTMLGQDLWGMPMKSKQEDHNFETTQRGLMYYVAQELLRSGQGTVTCSYLELYNEKIYDLIRGDDKTPLDLREDAVHGVFLPDLQVVRLCSEDSLSDILWQGAQTRACRATNMNERSSRSHTILQLHIDTVRGTSTINLVDLAGSEKCKKTTTRCPGQDMKELKFINQSLSTLAQCISALIKRDRVHDPWTSSPLSSVHIPYRNSKLTRLLQPSLGGGGLCSFIVTLNPCRSSAQETLSTLQFATRAMKVSVMCEPSDRWASQSNQATTLPSSSLAQSNDILVAMEKLRDENKKLLAALDAERQQKRKLLLGFTTLLNVENTQEETQELTHQTEDATAEKNPQVSIELYKKLSALEHSMQSQLNEIQATKRVLTTKQPPPEANQPEENWEEYVDAATGFKYYHNPQTGVTSWTKPTSKFVTFGAARQESAMDDPLGYVVENMVNKTVEELFASTEFLEELHLASMPGAISVASSEALRQYFSSDVSVGAMINMLFIDPKVHFTYKQAPSYLECAQLYQLQNLMVSSSFTSGILDTFLSYDKLSGRLNLVDQLLTFQPIGVMNAEALTRVCNAIFERTTISLLFSLYGNRNIDFFRGILFQIGRECMKELILRFCDDLFCEEPEQWESVPYQILQQVFPCTKLTSVRENLPTFDLDPISLEYKFPLMLYTCDFITDLIQENRPDTVGRYIVTQLTTNPILATTLVEGVLNDLWTLPSALSCESYGMKVLNSMLQLHHCGCISCHQEEHDNAREIDCQGTLNALWTAFVSRLPEFLQVLHIPPHQSFTLKHVQLLYLLYPVLRVSCVAVDEILMRDHTFERLLSLVQRYPNANILHTAVCRLFITCLEDCPVMFGQELQTRRTTWDPLRNSMLRESVFQAVIQGCESPLITCFKDIAMSFDELMMQNPPVSPELATLWHDFATTRLEDIRADWAIQLPNTGGDAMSERDEEALVNMTKSIVPPDIDDASPHDISDGPGTPFRKPETRKLAEILGPTPTDDLFLPTSSNSPPKTYRNGEPHSTPLNALYDQEEQDLIRQFSKATSDIVR